MKKLSLILAAILVVMSFPMMLMSNAFAADVVVTYTKDEATATTTSIADAITNADNNTTIYLTGGDYVLTARENWGLAGKDLTLDLGGNTVKNADSYNKETGAARIINLSYTGTSAATADTCSSLTLKNGYMQNTVGGCIFQVYAYQELIFGDGIVIDQHSTSQYGIAVMQNNCKVTFANGCVVRNTIATPFASAEEIAATPMYDNWYPVVGQNEHNTTITYEEGCYVESSGPAFKTNDNKDENGAYESDNSTVIVNGGTIVSQYKNLFPTAVTNCDLIINGGHIYNAILCPISGNNVTGGTVGKTAPIINWNGTGSTYYVSENAKFYTLNSQTVTQTFMGSATAAEGSKLLSELTACVMGQDSTQVSHMEGAQCRTVIDSLGLRFQSSFDKELVDMINNVAVDGSVKIGTLIAPYAYVQQTGGELTKKAFANNGLNCLNIPADKGMYVDTNGDTVVKAAIVNIKEANKSLDFVATAYIEWVDLAGNTHTAYTTPTPTDADARNILEVATAALEDVKSAPEGDYIHEIVLAGGSVYARITQEQYDALGKIVNSDI